MIQVPILEFETRRKKVSIAVRWKRGQERPL
jgi:hypothetical protein